jgi:hypothetical protein
MVRRSVLNEVGLFREDLPTRQDWDLWLRVTARHAGFFIAEPLANYTFRWSGISRSASIEENEQRQLAIVDSVCADDRVARFKTPAEAVIYRHSCSRYLAQAKTGRDLQKALKAVRKRPAGVREWTCVAMATAAHGIAGVKQLVKPLMSADG